MCNKKIASNRIRERLYIFISRKIITRALNRFRSRRRVSFNRFICDSRSTAELIHHAQFGEESFNRRRRVLLITFSDEADCSLAETRIRENAFSRFASGFSRVSRLSPLTHLLAYLHPTDTVLGGIRESAHLNAHTFMYVKIVLEPLEIFEFPPRTRLTFKGNANEEMSIALLNIKYCNFHQVKSIN